METVYDSVTGDALYSEESQRREREYPTWVGILDMGCEEQLVQTLTDAIQKYAVALGADGSVMNETDADNLYNLTWLLKAILKDCCGVDVE